MRSFSTLYPNIFGPTNYLCHYTSFENFFSILSTMTLNVCSFENSNDILEIESNISCLGNNQRILEIEQYIANQCGYVSFSINQWDEILNIITSVGYLIPSMWGIYANKSKGVCILLDKDILLQENAKSLSNSLWYSFFNVSYLQIQGQKLVPKTELVEDIVKKNYRHIIGVKHKSWEFEQEFRFVGCGLPSNLSLKNGVIRGVIIGNKSSKEDKEKLLSMLNNKNLECYNQIDKNKFVLQDILGGNVYTSDFGVYF